MALPHYAVLKIKKLRIHEIAAVAAHNNRSMPTPNADPTIKDGVVVLRCSGDDTFDAFEKRVQNSRAKLPGKNHIVAVEVVLALSPGAPSQPAEEVLFERSIRFLDETFGAQNTVCIWGHRDEKNPHVHALVVPIVKSQAPGRPKKGTAKEEQPVISWNKFSGSEIRAGKKPTNNPVMASWQSSWANLWLEHGYRCGIPSSRSSIPMQWIRGKTATIQQMGQIAENEMNSALDELAIEPEQLDELVETKTLSLELESRTAKARESIRLCCEPLVELAARGIQLDSERQARAELDDKLKAEQAVVKQLKEEAALRDEAAARAKIENSNLARENAQLRYNQSFGTTTQAHEILASLGDEDFDAIIEQARLDRESLKADKIAEAERLTARPFPMPKIDPGHSIK